MWESMMWEPAPGFTPRMEGLTSEALTALERLGEKVRALGGRLLVTSAYRPGDPLLHGRGKALDVWVPGWTHERIAETALQAGFVGGYIPHDKNFVEVTTAEHWYSVPGRIFGLEPDFPYVPGLTPPEPQHGLEPGEKGPPRPTALQDLEGRIQQGLRQAGGLIPDIDIIPDMPAVDWTRSGVIIVTVIILLAVFILIIWKM